MARRTTSELVRAVANLESTVDVDAYIDTASKLVDKVQDCDTKSGGNLDEQQLELIERWLAAHFTVISRPQVSSKSIGGASTSFLVGSVSDGIKATIFGQQALIMDTSGCLDGLTNTKAKVAWLGTSPRKQRNITDIYDA